MTMYSGMCVKGPLDGVRLATETREYQTLVVPELDFLSKPQDTAPAADAPRRETYRFCPLNFVDEHELKETGLFLHQSVRGLGEAVEHIFTMYSIHAQLVENRC